MYLGTPREDSQPSGPTSLIQIHQNRLMYLGTPLVDSQPSGPTSLIQNVRLLGLHSPQHCPNPIGKFNFGASRQQLQESNYDDVTYVEYHRVLPVELQFRLHERCAELLFARGVMW
jgi:hypothetical protein